MQENGNVPVPAGLVLSTRDLHCYVYLEVVVLGGKLVFIMINIPGGYWAKTAIGGQKFKRDWCR